MCRSCRRVQQTVLIIAMATRLVNTQASSSSAVTALTSHTPHASRHLGRTLFFFVKRTVTAWAGSSIRQA